MNDYVAELQIHMSLQARNLVPNLTSIENPCHRLIAQEIAAQEIAASRLRIS